MKYAEIKNLQGVELKKRLVQTEQALFDCKMKHNMQRLSNIMEIANHRRDLARLRTALSAFPDRGVGVRQSSLEAGAVKSVSVDNEGGQKKAKVAKGVVVDKPLAQKPGTGQKSGVDVKLDKKVTEGVSQKAQEVSPSSSDKKMDVQKEPVEGEQLKSTKPLGVKSGTGVRDDKSLLKSTKKWFSFGKSSTSKSKAKAGKRSFFRRKSG